MTEILCDGNTQHIIISINLVVQQYSNPFVKYKLYNTVGRYIYLMIYFVIRLFTIYNKLWKLHVMIISY